VCSETVKKYPVRGSGCRPPAHYHDIQPAKFFLVRPEGLSDDSLQPVPLNGQSAIPFGNCQAQPGALSAVVPGQNGEHCVTAPLCLFEYMLKRPGIEQSLVPRKPLTGACLPIFVFVCRNGDRRS
jgi:hypothetical protein